ncbi:hypothetical protein VB716_14500 [Synechococcus sp. CCY9201]|jgi:hypothetical protein|uniref:hypothetical protein n=1 Tax=unclassified Synechococcus TaxID=2626047 RepID=UPI0018CFD312|nr:MULTISPECIES: hypothetical protein [unclassified Synechococcus]MEA5422781.1 hypothetical protein [Synechococcus sp. CCY9202]MEA5475429.1 hypothetical protein [Synechococcus sp. CCY9201]QPN59887.1 hypothetical protein H8F24_18490 [Synechococcus sp. CBW1002]QPN66686.1 hypothetical protein H8F26_18600 [Synechococcus sp. CBW1006]
MACPSCGSWAVRADRSLAGRMVCGRCGRPLTGTVVELEQHRRRRRGWMRLLPRLPRRNLSRRWWALIALLAISALLATLPEQPSRPRAPSPIGTPDAPLF